MFNHKDMDAIEQIFILSIYCLYKVFVKWTIMFYLFTISKIVMEL